MSNQKKLVVFTAPSGAGKTTIVRHLLKTFPQQLAFSVSATTRKARTGEVDGKDYYFLSVEKFKRKIEENAFVEWEEVYENQFYGTLKSEVERLWNKQYHILFDIDVLGATSIKKCYPKQALTVFVKPPNKDILFDRLRGRETETDKNLLKRFKRAEEELKFENKFDLVLVNDVLADTLQEAERLVLNFTNFSTL